MVPAARGRCWQCTQSSRSVHCKASVDRVRHGRSMHPSLSPPTSSPTPGLETPSTLISGLRDSTCVQGSGLVPASLSPPGAVHLGPEAHILHGSGTAFVAGVGVLSFRPA